MNTATDMKKLEQERQGRLFEAMMAAFVKEWEPEDRRERAQFHAEFHSLVRQIYRDAQQPLLDQLAKFAVAMPMQFMIPNDSPKQK